MSAPSLWDAPRAAQRKLLAAIEDYQDTSVMRRHRPFFDELCLTYSERDTSTDEDRADYIIDSRKDANV